MVISAHNDTAQQPESRSTLDCDMYALIIDRNAWTVAQPICNICQTCESNDQQLFEGVKTCGMWKAYGTKTPTKHPRNNDDDKALRKLAGTNRKLAGNR